MALRTRPGTKPVYISPGHRISLEMAIAYVMRCTTKYRLPERLAMLTNWLHFFPALRLLSFCLLAIKIHSRLENPEVYLVNRNIGQGDRNRQLLCQRLKLFFAGNFSTRLLLGGFEWCNQKLDRPRRSAHIQLEFDHHPGRIGQTGR